MQDRALIVKILAVALCTIIPLILWWDTPTKALPAALVMLLFCVLVILSPRHLILWASVMVFLMAMVTNREGFPNLLTMLVANALIAILTGVTVTIVVRLFKIPLG